jgi:MYXO-CTERM domain-containing protein
MFTLIPGQLPETWVADFRPGSAGDDDPAGVARVPASWAGGSVVAAGEHIVVDSGDNDVVFAVSSSGVPRAITADLGTRTLTDVAVGPNAIFVVDRENAAILAMSGSASTVAATLQTVNGGLITGTSVIVGLEYDFTSSSLLVALGGTQDQILRLSAAGANTWAGTVIGAGFDFDDTSSSAIGLSPDGSVLTVATSNAIRTYARCSLVTAPDCNANGTADFCDIWVSATPDCNENSVPDACDLAALTSTDCDTDGVPDECAACPPLDVVFNVDTSASNQEEADLLCNTISGIVSNLAAEDLVVDAHILGIGVPAAGLGACPATSVASALGSDVPGSPPDSPGAVDQDTLGECPGGSVNDACADWGRATSVVAGLYPFAAGKVPVVVNVADEGPHCGSTTMDQADGDAITWATQVAVERGVIVSSVLGTDYQLTSNVPMESYAVNLANATGGTVSREPLGTMVQGIQAVLRGACRARRVDVCAGGDAGVGDAGPVTDAASDAGTSLTDATTPVDALASGANDAAWTAADAAITPDANTTGGAGNGVEAGVAGSGAAGGDPAGGQGGTGGSQDNGSDAAVAGHTAGQTGATVEAGVPTGPSSDTAPDASTSDAALAGSGDTSGCACGVTGRSSDLRGLTLLALGVVFTVRRRRNQ